MKETIDIEIKFGFNWTYGIEISELKEDLEALEALGATHVYIEPDRDYDSCRVDIWAICRREETDEEYNKRLYEEKVKEENERQVILQKERRQYEILKAKFEGK